jgi:Tripartite tricarboxylate transporter family receptor
LPLLRWILSSAFVICIASPAASQAYPDRPIRLIAPFPAGGLADVLARAVGDEMSKALGQPVVVENRAGAGGNTGADAVAKAAPDGYTLLMSSAGILTANPFLYAKMPFDAETALSSHLPARRLRSSRGYTGKSRRPSVHRRCRSVSPSPAPAWSAIRRPSLPSRSARNARNGARSSGRRTSRRSSTARAQAGAMNAPIFCRSVRPRPRSALPHGWQAHARHS